MKYLRLAIIGALDAIQRIYNRNIATPSIEGVMLMQVKYIVYDTFQATYYTTVLPLRFLQVMRAVFHIIFPLREIYSFLFNRASTSSTTQRGA